MVDERTNTREDSSISRRSALKLAGGASGAALFSTAPVGGVTTDGEDIRQSMSDIHAQSEESDQPAGTDALLNFLEARYGDRLSDEELGELEEDVADNLRAANALEEVELKNSDEPAFTFQPYRGDE